MPAHRSPRVGVQPVGEAGSGAGHCFAAALTPCPTEGALLRSWDSQCGARGQYARYGEFRSEPKGPAATKSATFNPTLLVRGCLMEGPMYRSRESAGELQSRWALAWPIAVGVLIGNILTAIAALFFSIAFGALLMSAFEKGVADQMRRTVTPGYLPARPGQIEQRPYRDASPRRADLPYLNGPIAAGKYGDDKACINGRVAERLQNGWRQQYDQRCEQAAP